MIKKCIGCGSILQSENVNNEGFVKSNVYDKSEYCERCFKIKNYGEYSVLDKKIDTDGIIRNINSDTVASVVFLVDVLNINENIKKVIKKFKNNKYILITKKDILPKSLKEKKIISYFKENIYNSNNIMMISSLKKYNIDLFMNKIKKDNIKRLYVVGFTNAGKSTLINTILTNLNNKPVITTSSIPNTTANFLTIKIDSSLTIVDTPGFIDLAAIYNFIDYKSLIKLYPKKEIKVKTFQVRSGQSIVVNNILRIDNLGDKTNYFSFYMSDKLRYEKVKFKNNKLCDLQSVNYTITYESDILIHGLGFVKISRNGEIKVYSLDNKIISKRRSILCKK